VGEIAAILRRVAVLPGRGLDALEDQTRIDPKAVAAPGAVELLPIHAVLRAGKCGRAAHLFADVPIDGMIVAHEPRDRCIELRLELHRVNIEPDEVAHQRRWLLGGDSRHRGDECGRDEREGGAKHAGDPFEQTRRVNAGTAFYGVTPARCAAGIPAIVSASMKPAFPPVLIPVTVFAQAQPQPPEVEIPFPADIPIPPATVLSPEETLKTIKVPPGFKVELVASEPLISTPVAMQWDEDGRLWVVEMNGYMPNVDGKGEGTPNGRVVVLEDTDGDGRMDKSTVFLDQLVMPRAIMLRKGGALICEPPAVYWCADANHDLKADGKEPVIPNYVTGGNPEHAPNGLLLAMDNWIYNAKSNKRYRFAATARSRPRRRLRHGHLPPDDWAGSITTRTAISSAPTCCRARVSHA
jgi:hypothetical protein